MKKIFSFLLLVLSCKIAFTQLKKQHWTRHYFLSGNVAILYGGDKTGTGINVDLGKNLSKNFKIGVGYCFAQFAELKKVSILNLVVEKDFVFDKRTLFINVKPGIAIPLFPSKQLTLYDWNNYNNAKNGFNLQSNIGIKKSLGSHSYFVSIGYNTTTYTLTSSQNLFTPIPNKTETIIHNFALSFNRLQLCLGLSF